MTYNQAADANYSAAAQVTETTTAQQAGQSTSVTTPAPLTATYNSSFSVAATGGASGQPVLIAASGACSAGGSGSATMTMTTGTGACTVTYNQVVTPTTARWPR